MSSDKYCWICLKDSDLVARCTNCFRSYHLNCGKYSSNIPGWVCPVCLTIAKKTRISSKDGGKELTELLHFAWEQMMSSANAFNLLEDKVKYPNYEYILNHLTEIGSTISSNKYQCTEALLADIKRIYCNCVYFQETKLVPLAKEIVKICKQEIKEIDTCNECYRNSKTIKDWFTEVHATPHLLLWAKVKTFPYWPAKVMFVKPNLVSVTFFGQHEHACVPFNDCYLYSEKDPNLMIPKSKRNDFTDSIKEIDIYIKNIKEKFGSFIYSDFKSNFEPKNIKNHLQAMIPNLNNTTSDPKPSIKIKIVKIAENKMKCVQINKVNDNTSENDVRDNGGGKVSLLKQPKKSGVRPADSDKDKIGRVLSKRRSNYYTVAVPQKKSNITDVLNDDIDNNNTANKINRDDVQSVSAPVNSSNTVISTTTNENETTKSTTNTTTMTAIDLIPTCDIKIKVDEQTPIEKNVSEKEKDQSSMEQVNSNTNQTVLLTSHSYSMVDTSNDKTAPITMATEDTISCDIDSIDEVIKSEPLSDSEQTSATSVLMPNGSSNETRTSRKRSFYKCATIPSAATTITTSSMSSTINQTLIRNPQTMVIIPIDNDTTNSNKNHSKLTPTLALSTNPLDTADEKSIIDFMDFMASKNKIKSLELEITRLNFELKELKKKQWCANCSAEWM